MGEDELLAQAMLVAAYSRVAKDKWCNIEVKTRSEGSGVLVIVCSFALESCPHVPIVVEARFTGVRTGHVEIVRVGEFVGSYYPTGMAPDGLGDVVFARVCDALFESYVAL